MIVVVKPYLFLRDILGFRSQELTLSAGDTVNDLLNLLRSSYKMPDQVILSQGRLVLFEGHRPVGLTLLLNGRNIGQIKGLDTALSEGDTVTLFPPAAGG